MFGSRCRKAAVGLVVCAGASIAASAPASATFSSTPKDRVIGIGTNNPPLLDIAAFILDAKSGPNGESPGGIGAFGMKVPDPMTKFTYNAGIVKCLRVSGNTATLVYKIQWSRRLPGSLSTVDATRVWVQDNGTPSSFHDPVDRVRNQLFDSVKRPQLLSCPDPADPATTAFINEAGPLTTGDTLVVDN